MKTVYKLVLKSYLGPMFMTFFIVMFVLLMNFMWRYIDELVGKGLSPDVILELMFYAALTMIPMGLPLATLLASIMTLGNLGENNELLALKSAGISLPRILKPLAILVFLIAVASFFAANNLVPYSFKKMSSIIYDIRQQRQTLEFDNGIFFNGIEDMSIRVENQDPETSKLTNILIYDTRKTSGVMTTTVADSGYIRLSDDKKYLLITLFHGETYEENRGFTWYERNTLTHHIFKKQEGIIPLVGFNFERSDASFFTNNKTKNVIELQTDIDSIRILVNQGLTSINEQVVNRYVFVNDRTILVDSIQQTKKQIDLRDSLKQGKYSRYQVLSAALQSAKSVATSMDYDASNVKENVALLYQTQNEWHKKLALPFSIIIFFLIGAPLGAIIRKGGLGMPIVVSVIFFVFYYIVMIIGEKMSREGTWTPFVGTWISSFILFPLSVFLTYKATNDSGLMNVDWYILKYKKFKTIAITIIENIKAKRYGKRTKE